GDGNVGLAGRTRRSRNGYAFQRKGISSIKGKCAGKAWQTFDLRHRGGGTTKGNCEVAGAGAKSKTQKGNRVAAGWGARIRKNLQYGGTVAEGRWRHGDPAVGKVGGEIHGAGHGAQRRRDLQLCGACRCGIDGGLRPKANLWIGGEIRTAQADGCTTRVGSFRRLCHRGTRKDRRVLRQRRRTGGIQEIQTTIREPYEQLGLVRVFQDRRNALNRKVGNLPKLLEVGHGKRRNDMAVAERLGHVERLSIAGKNNSGGAWRGIGT